MSFKTIWPGWYTGRAIHIHVRVRKLSGSGATIAGYTTQIFFSDADNDTVLAGAAPYDSRSPRTDPTTDENDTVLQSSDHATNVVPVTGSIGKGFAATFNVMLDESQAAARGSSAGPRDGRRGRAAVPSACSAEPADPSAYPLLMGTNAGEPPTCTSFSDSWNVRPPVLPVMASRVKRPCTGTDACTVIELTVVWPMPETVLVPHRLRRSRSTRTSGASGRRRRPRTASRASDEPRTRRPDACMDVHSAC